MDMNEKLLQTNADEPTFNSPLEKKIFDVLRNQKVGISLGYLQSQVKARTSWEAKQILDIVQSSNWAVVRAGKIYFASLIEEKAASPEIVYNNLHTVQSEETETDKGEEPRLEWADKKENKQQAFANMKAETNIGRLENPNIEERTKATLSLEERVRQILLRNGQLEGLTIFEFLSYFPEEEKTNAFIVLQKAHWVVYKNNKYCYRSDDEPITESHTEIIPKPDTRPKKNTVQEQSTGFTKPVSFSSISPLDAKTKQKMDDRELEDRIRRVFKKYGTNAVVPLEQMVRITKAKDGDSVIRILRSVPWADYKPRNCYYYPDIDTLQKKDEKRSKQKLETEFADTRLSKEAFRQGVSYSDFVKYESLAQRVIQQIQEKQYRLLCQLPISEEDYTTLLRYTKDTFRNMQTRSIVKPDILLSITLVQIAIRYYCEGRYWPCVTDELGIMIPVTKTYHAARIFLKTLQEYHLLMLPVGSGDTQYVENIKAHAFVTDWYIQRFYDFVSAYYENNLFRELASDIQEDFDELSAFMRTTLLNNDDCISDSDDVKRASKSYRLLKSTRAVFAYAGSKTIHDVFFPILQYFDQYYYDDKLPQASKDRFSIGFVQWVHELESKEPVHTGRQSRKGQLYSRRPYLSVNVMFETATIVIPPQKIRHVSESNEVSVTIQAGGKTYKRFLNLYHSFGVLLSEELRVSIPDVFDEILIQITSSAVKEFKISARSYRIFNRSWNSIPRLREGQNYLLVKKGIPVACQHEKDLIEKNEYYLHWCYYSLRITDESSIQIGDTVLSVMGEYSSDPIFDDIAKDFLITDTSNRNLHFVKKHPKISFLVEKKKLRGTAIRANDEKYLLENISEKAIMDWPKDRNVAAVQLDLDSVLPEEDGLYSIVLDVPAETNKTICEYAVLRNFSLTLDKERYIYDEKAVLRINKGTHFIESENDCQPLENDIDGVASIHLPLKGANPCFSLMLDEAFHIRMPVPVFQYGFAKAEMRCDRPQYFWYKDLGETLYLHVPGATSVYAEYCTEKETIRKTAMSDGKSAFQIDFSAIKQSIMENREKEWHYITLCYSGNGERQISLPAVLRYTEIKPYFQINNSADELSFNVSEITGIADVYLNVIKEQTGEPVLTDIPVVKGKNILPPLEKKTVYSLCPFMKEEDAFGFEDEVTNLPKICGVSVEDWNDLEGCSLQISFIHVNGKMLECGYEYYIILEEKVGENCYLGNMFARSSNNHSDKDKADYTRKYGKAMITLSISANELYANVKLYSYCDERWSALYYDSQSKYMLHGDEWILTQKERYPGRFIMLNTLFKINTDKIRRIQYVVPTI